MKDREAWRAAVHGIAKSQTQLRDWAYNKNRIQFRNTLTHIHSDHGLKQQYNSVNKWCRTKCLPGETTLNLDSYLHFSSVQSLSSVQLCDPMNRSMPGFPVLHQLLELTQTHVHWVDDSIQPSHPLSSPSPPPSIFPSIRVFSSESVLHIRWPKYCSFSFSIIPSNEYSGLISFRMDWLDLLVVQGTLKSLLQHHSTKASILRCSAFFMVLSLTSTRDYWKNHRFD